MRPIRFQPGLARSAQALARLRLDRIANLRIAFARKRTCAFYGVSLRGVRASVSSGCVAIRSIAGHPVARWRRVLGKITGVVTCLIGSIPTILADLSRLKPSWLEMSSDERVHRMWVLSSPGRHCVGAILDGYVEDVTPPGVTKQFVSMVSVAAVGEDERREHDGAVFYHAPIVSALEADGDEFDTFAEAVAWLERRKRELLTLGWQEISFDPINDPN